MDSSNTTNDSTKQLVLQNKLTFNLNVILVTAECDFSTEFCIRINQNIRMTNKINVMMEAVMEAFKIKTKLVPLMTYSLTGFIIIETYFLITKLMCRG